MTDNPLRTPTEYERALKEIEIYFENPPEPGTEAADRFERLVVLITAYEDVNFPIPATTERPRTGTSKQSADAATQELIDFYRDGLERIADHAPGTPGLHGTTEELLSSAVGIAKLTLDMGAEAQGKVEASREQASEKDA